MHQSIYETHDWDAEAKRIAAAFNVKGECRFKEVLGQKGVVRLISTQGSQYVYLEDDTILTVRAAVPAAGRFYFYYSLSKRIDGNSNAELLWASFDSGRLEECSYSSRLHVPRFVRALFCLDLLTPEIERELNVSLTAHEKLEWARDYEARYGF